MNLIKINKQCLFLTVILMLCVLILMPGCSKKKKQASESLPGQEWLTDMRARVEKTITDPGKKSEFMGLLGQEERALRELHEDAGKFFSDIKATDRNYNSTPEDFKKLFAEYNAKRKQHRDQSIEVRFKMRALVTAKEWEKIADFSKRKGLFNQVIQHPGQ